MTVFFTSDTHFGHANIIRFCGRPFKDTDHMDEQIIERWNSVVGPDDTVFHLGDVALGQIAVSLPKVGRLNGEKILIVGNHERIFSDNSEKHRARFYPEYEKVFDTIVGEQGMNYDLGSDNVYLSHFPYEGDHTETERHSDKRAADLGQPLIHGHTHENKVITYSRLGSLQIHVGQDAWDYTPVSEDQIIELIKESG
jgi:calcineurin-like phosphoesterase family protein